VHSFLPKEAQKAINAMPINPKDDIKAEPFTARKVAQVMRNNGFSVELPPFGSVAICLYPYLARATHSCSPNMEVLTDGIILKLVATRSIRLIVSLLPLYRYQSNVL